MLLVIQVEEQLCETEPHDSTFDLEKTENQLGSIGGDSGSAHQEDLLEGDLGLGTVPALAGRPEAPGVTSNPAYQSLLP